MTGASDDPYQVLGVGVTVSDEDLRTAWRAAVKRTHPDSGGDAESFRLTQWAWELLSDPSVRAAYDSGIKAAAIRDRPAPGGTAQGTTPGTPPGTRFGHRPQGVTQPDRYTYAAQVTEVWVYNRVLFTHGYSKVVSMAVVTDDRMLRDAISHLTKAETEDLCTLAKRDWSTQVHRLRVEARPTSRLGGRWFTQGRRPAGSFNSRVFAVLWFSAVAAFNLAGNAAVDQLGLSAYRPLEGPAEVMYFFTVTVSFLLPFIAVFLWAPTWALSWARYGWGERPRRYAAVTAVSALWCFEGVLFVNPAAFTAAVCLTTGAGFASGRRADRRADAGFPPAPSRFATWRATMRADRLQRRTSAANARQKARAARSRKRDQVS
jgi:hypothetical protein